MDNDSFINQHPVFKKCKQDADKLMNNFAALATLFGAYCVLSIIILFAF